MGCGGNRLGLCPRGRPIAGKKHQERSDLRGHIRVLTVAPDHGGVTLGVRSLLRFIGQVGRSVLASSRPK